MLFRAPGMSAGVDGRVKVSTKPDGYPDAVGSITAIQPTIAAPVAGGTVEADVSVASNVVAFCTGVFAGCNVTFEGSLELAGNAWFGLQAVRTNANTIETATGALSAAPVYAWELSVNALRRVRVRCTARTSGQQDWRFVLGTYATEPIPAAQVSATQPVTGTVNANCTLNAPTPYALNSVAGTNTGAIKAAAGTLYALAGFNSGAGLAYVKIYNKATAPALAADVPVLVVPVPAGGAMPPVQLGALGHRFTAGIAIAVTGGAADTDATAVAAGQVKVLADYV